MTLTGFTRDTSFTPVPNPVLGQVLEDVQDLAELKVTLRALWLLHRKKGRLLAISVEELLADRCLWRGLSGPGKDPDAEVRRGLELAVRRGTFLSCPGPVQTASGAPESGQLVFLNDEAGRLAMARQREQGGTFRRRPRRIPNRLPARSQTYSPCMKIISAASPPSSPKS